MAVNAEMTFQTYESLQLNQGLEKRTLGRRRAPRKNALNQEIALSSPPLPSSMSCKLKIIALCLNRIQEEKGRGLSTHLTSKRLERLLKKVSKKSFLSIMSLLVTKEQYAEHMQQETKKKLYKDIVLVLPKEWIHAGWDSENWRTLSEVPDYINMYLLLEKSSCVFILLIWKIYLNYFSTFTFCFFTLQLTFKWLNILSSDCLLARWWFILALPNSYRNKVSKVLMI